MGLEQVFNEAAERVKQLSESPSNEDQLELYANFKQANVGDCSVRKLSSVLDFFNSSRKYLLA
jgi:acyl-CoA-binding protein